MARKSFVVFSLDSLTASRFAPRRFLSAVTATLRRYQARRAVRELLSWSDQHLADIGLTRGDVHQALRDKGRNCSARLQALADSRRFVAPRQAAAVQDKPCIAQELFESTPQKAA